MQYTYIYSTTTYSLELDMQTLYVALGSTTVCMAIHKYSIYIHASYRDLSYDESILESKNILQSLKAK